MSIFINHAYGELYGLYSDEDYDEIRNPPAPDEPVADNEPFPAPTFLERPPCSNCKDPNLSLSSSLCIACRLGMR